MGGGRRAVEKLVDFSFFKGKRVFLTGHTGFKGAWMARILVNAGAQVTGYALEPPDGFNLWKFLDMERDMRSVIGDIRDLPALKKAFDESQPEIVVHMAAQPIVRESYRDPAGTYAVNVMGTVNVLECVRRGGVRSFLNVTTDKVYQNNEWCWGYRENDALDGFDPYSNSKSCSELVTAAYNRSFLKEMGVAASTARAGNVIGGGDFAADRIVPDCVRAVTRGEPIGVRNPYSIRPYQHVLEALGAYLLILKEQYEKPETAGCYNVGPDDGDCIATGDLARLFCDFWGDGAEWADMSELNAPHEANFLKLDCSKLKAEFGWKPKWDIETAVQKTVEWEQARIGGADVRVTTDRQIEGYFG